MTKPGQCRDVRKRENKNENRSNTIMVVERDIIRNLIVPRDTNRKVTTLLSESQFNRIKENSRLISDTWERIEAVDQEKMSLQKEIEKNETLKRELKQLKAERDQEIDEEERRRNQEIRERSEALRREEEDIIKKCNSLILSVKCKAIQDAQVAEKKLIRQQLKHEEHLFDSKMEDEQKRTLETIKKKREHEWARKREYAKSILEQIEHNEERRLRQMQMIRKERKAMKLKIDKQNDDDKWRSEELSVIQLETKKQNERINEEIKRKKELEKQMETLESLKIQEYLKDKLEKEKELEKQRRKEKQMEERELARLWKLQKSSRLLQESKNDIVAERIQEQIQRKWRQNELETIRRKIRETEELKKIRDRQIQEKRKGQISTIEEKKEQAEKIAIENQKLKAELEALQSKQKQIMVQHKVSLKEQINEKERTKKKQREEILKEGEDLLARIQKRDRIIKETMKKKIDQIRCSNIPAVYVRNLEKQMQLS